MGYVPEDRRIFGDLTVKENLIVGEKGSGGWTAARVYAFFPKLAEMARRREKLRLTRNDNVIGCPLCTVTPAGSKPATTSQQQQQP